MAKILITGGAGFIGSNLTMRLLSEGNEVTVVDDLSMGLQDNLPQKPNLTFIQQSITNSEFMSDLLIERNFDFIYLLAAVASVADSVERPIETHEINQEANLRIFETIRTHRLHPKRVIFSSSAAVYGDEPSLPKTEASPITPLTPYAIDKFATERFLMAYANLYQINASAVRFFNVFGPHQNPQSPYSGVLSILTQTFKTEGSFCVFGDGQQSRDFIYITDVLDALQLLARNDSAKGQVFNVATGQTTTLLDVIKDYEEITNKRITVTYANMRQGDIRHSWANIDKLSALGFEPHINVYEGLRRYWQYINR